MLQNDELQLSNIIGVDPVFGSLSHKVLLRATGGAVALRWVAARTDEVVQTREVNNESIIVVLEERFGV